MNKLIPLALVASALAVGAALMSSGAPIDPKVSATPSGYQFTETFPWKGSHAASTTAGTGTTVWWSEDHWDAGGDTSYIAVAGVAQSTNGYHVDIHKAQNATPHSGVENNSVPTVGGDGSEGIGVMHVDNYDIVGSRLRNPLLLQNGTPGVITFYASRLNTSAHWWEINLSPTAQPTSPHFTPVPAPYPGRMVPGPVAGSGALSTNGHRHALDGVNIIAVGSNDVPCDTGWSTRFALTRRLNGVSDYAVNQRPSYSALPVQLGRGNAASIAKEASELYRWKIEVTPNANGPETVRMWLDANRDDAFSASELIETWSTEIPWGEVYVSLLAVAYSAGEHHPQGGCYLGSIREFTWRNVEVSPVKYLGTATFPKNIGTDNVPQRTGWRSFDLRDTQRFGGVNAVTKAPQPNASAYNLSGGTGVACGDTYYPCFGAKPGKILLVDIPAPPPGARVARAQLVFDHRGQQGFDLTVNGHIVGYVPGQSTEPNTTSGTGEPDLWMRRSVDIPAAYLVAGTNTVALALRRGARGAYVDRLEIELGYELTGGAPPAPEPEPEPEPEPPPPPPPPPPACTCDCPNHPQ